MFQFTREFIINDNGTGVAGTKDLLKDGKRFKVDGNTLLVAGMTNLRKEDIVSASKVAAAAAVNEVLELKPDSISALADETIFRLILTISQQGRVTALVNDWHPMHKKQYFYEAVAAKSATKLPLEGFAAVASKEATMEAPDRLIDVVATANMLTIKALDPYTRIDEVRVVSVPKVAAVPTAEILTGYMDFDTVLLWTKKDGAVSGVTAGNADLTAGTEGAGTVAQILKNKRLLSAANLDPYGQDLDERPVPGALYDQYLVETVSERRHIGGQVFGSIDHSLTSNVFFVRANATCEAEDASSAFAEALGQLVTIENVEAVDPSPAVDEAKTLPKDVIAKAKAETETESSPEE